MELTAIQLDKVLITVFFSVLAAFITAAISIVRLVNDKESKTTDYRQAWTESLRKSLADLVSNINLLASNITSRLSAVDHANELTEHVIKKESDDERVPATLEKLQDYLDKKILDEDSHIRDIRRNMYQSYAFTRLHFKPNDLSFSRVENKFDLITDMVEKIAEMRGKEFESERLILRERIHSSASEITAYSRDILKIEWETVKKGERAYQKTKTWSLIGGGIALFILLIFGAATVWTVANGRHRYSANISSGEVPVKARTEAIHCDDSATSLSAPTTNKNP